MGYDALNFFNWFGSGRGDCTTSMLLLRKRVVAAAAPDFCDHGVCQGWVTKLERMLLLVSRQLEGLAELRAVPTTESAATKGPFRAYKSCK